MDAVGKVGLPAARRLGFNVSGRARFARLGEFPECLGDNFSPVS
jgi:hypothetical protein